MTEFTVFGISICRPEAPPSELSAAKLQSELKTPGGMSCDVLRNRWLCSSSHGWKHFCLWDGYSTTNPQAIHEDGLWQKQIQCRSRQCYWLENLWSSSVVCSTRNPTQATICLCSRDATRSTCVLTIRVLKYLKVFTKHARRPDQDQTSAANVGRHGAQTTSCHRRHRRRSSANRPDAHYGKANSPMSRSSL